MLCISSLFAVRSFQNVAGDEVHTVADEALRVGGVIHGPAVDLDARVVAGLDVLGGVTAPLAPLCAPLPPPTLK